MITGVDSHLSQTVKTEVVLTEAVREAVKIFQ